MVAIAPFRALRYAPEVVQDLSRVVAPPYDVISAEDQARLYAASPYNVVRLICGREAAADTPQDNRYTRARSDFDAWCDQRVLRRDAEPSLSLIEHTFTWNGAVARRLGFLGLLRFDEAGDTSVIPHEATLEQPRADRRKLLEAVPANLSPIFCVYPDAGGAVRAVLERLRAREPAATATVGAELVRIWAVTDPAAIEEIVRRLADVSVLIADGHHRYEVARANGDRYGAVMTYFVSIEDPGLRVRPIHRLVQRQGPQGLDALRGACAIEPVDTLAGLLARLDDPTPARFGAATQGQLYVVTIQEDARLRWSKALPGAAAVAALDVSLLHGQLLPMMGIADREISYAPDAADAVAAVQSGRSALAWLLRGLSIDQVYSMASQGLTLPPKTTFFYPKVLSGLAFNPFVA